jgi:energy-coupling factor transporter ATP-binding protein EcfA2
MVPAYKRVLVIGCSGSGKSTLANCLGGSKRVWNDDENEFQWESQSGRADFIFDASHSTGSVTKTICFANMNFLGDKHRPFILVDTPGHDDPDSADLETKKSRGVLKQHAADLYLKLKMMKHVNLILIMHNDVNSNRINPATLELLKKVGEMFQGSESSVWNHVALAYTKCDADSVAWRDQLSQKKREMQSAIRSKFPACTEQVRLPIFRRECGRVRHRSTQAKFRVSLAGTFCVACPQY